MCNYYKREVEDCFRRQKTEKMKNIVDKRVAWVNPIQNLAILWQIYILFSLVNTARALLKIEIDTYSFVSIIDEPYAPVPFVSNQC